jgi:hypothetical protein
VRRVERSCERCLVQGLRECHEQAVRVAG